MSALPKQLSKQSRTDREYILANLPPGTFRVQVINSQGTQQYKRPDEVDVVGDIISLSGDGSPVVMRGKPGRPTKTNLKPVTPEIAVVSQAREELINTSPLVREATKNSSGDPILDELVKGLVEEATAIEFERCEAQRHGRSEDVTAFATRRARVLKSASDLILKRKALEKGGVVDLDSPAFQALFSLLLSTFKEAMVKGGCRSEQIEQTFTGLVSSLDDSWKSEARARMKDKNS
jgi:hypothetical protein